MKVLVTGFDPFGGEPVNPAFEAVKRLPRTIAGAHVDILEIPTVFHRSIEAIVKRAEEMCADRILMVGQAGGASRSPWSGWASTWTTPGYRTTRATGPSTYP